MKSIVSTVLDTIFKSKNWHFSFQKSLEVTVVFYRELMEVNCLYGFRVSSFKFWENRFEKFKIILKSFVNLIQSNVYFFYLNDLYVLNYCFKFDFSLFPSFFSLSFLIYLCIVRRKCCFYEALTNNIRTNYEQNPYKKTSNQSNAVKIGQNPSKPFKCGYFRLFHFIAI